MATLYRGLAGADAPEVGWLARDEAGHALPSRVYLARFQTGKESQVQKLMLVKANADSVIRKSQRNQSSISGMNPSDTKNLSASR